MEPEVHETGSDEDLIDFEALKAQLKIGHTKIYGMIAKGEFPAPIKIGTASRWVRGEVRAWVADRRAERPRRAS